MDEAIFLEHNMDHRRNVTEFKRSCNGASYTGIIMGQVRPRCLIDEQDGITASYED
jgi:hypothetical protein